jgi:hypothetical protein
MMLVGESRVATPMALTPPAGLTAADHEQQE